MNTTIYTLKYQAKFLSEEQSKLSTDYSQRVAEEKIASGAKNDLQAQAWFELERHGV